MPVTVFCYNTYSILYCTILYVYYTSTHIQYYSVVCQRLLDGTDVFDYNTVYMVTANMAVDADRLTTANMTVVTDFKRGSSDPSVDPFPGIPI